MTQAPINVLMFEDDEGQALLTREALEQEGFVVDVVATGREGLTRLLAADYQVHLIDMKLPDIPGVEILRRINTVKPGALSIIVTGHGDELAAVEAMKLGAFDYIVKSPYMSHLAALPMVIREALGHRRVKHEREELQTELWEQARLLEERNAELRRANEELKRMNQLKSDLISMVSHELRTPLATVKEFTAIMADGIAGPITADQKDYLGIVRSNVDRLSRIIDDLLDMAKIEAGRVLLTKGLVDVAPLVDHVLRSLRPLADSTQISLEAAVPDGAAPVFADADKVTQVLVNLLSNAIKFTSGPGRVTVRVSEQPNEVEFSVTDTGIGISAEDLPKLFEKFQQLKPGVAPAGAKGTGLGLAISKRLVEMHGGRIWAASAPGQGSTFTFTLPKYHVEEVFRDYLRSGLEQAKQHQRPFSIIVVSISKFDELKALMGLEETSALLKELEVALKETVRRGAGDVVVRWQRGEMVVILAAVDKAGAEAIAGRIRQVIGEREFQVVGKPIRVSVTTATATYPDEASTEEELLKAAEGKGQPAPRYRMRVLVVDDEAKIRKFLKDALELRDYEVIVAANGPDALEQLKRQKADVILLDLMMPVMDGYEVYHLLRENPQTKQIPVIIVTGKGERKDRELGLESASYNYVTKPFELEELLGKVREVLQHQHVIRS